MEIKVNITSIQLGGKFQFMCTPELEDTEECRKAFGKLIINDSGINATLVIEED